MKLVAMYLATALILLSSCIKKEQLGETYVSEETKKWLPENETVIFRNQNSQTTELPQISCESEFHNELWDTDAGFPPYRQIESYADLETITTIFKSETITLSYILSSHRNNSGTGIGDKIEIIVKDNNTSNTCKAVCSGAGDNYYGDEPLSVDSIITPNNTVLHNVFCISASNGRLWYLQEGKGIIAFEMDNKTWYIAE